MKKFDFIKKNTLIKTDNGSKLFFNIIDQKITPESFNLVKSHNTNTIYSLREIEILLNKKQIICKLKNYNIDDILKIKISFNQKFSDILTFYNSYSYNINVDLENENLNHIIFKTIDDLMYLRNLNIYESTSNQLYDQSYIEKTLLNALKIPLKYHNNSDEIILLKNKKNTVNNKIRLPSDKLILIK